MRQTVVALVLVVWCAPVLGPLGPSSSTAQESAGPHVVHFYPEGTIKKIRQVTARFSVPMVPLGDPRPASDVFDIACPEVGTARWVESSDWAYDFARDLPAGVRCTFRLRAGLVTLGGKPVGGQRDRKSTRLNSSHPSISYAVFCLKKKKRRSIDEDGGVEKVTVTVMVSRV